MYIEAKLLLEKKELTRDYRRCILSFLKAALSRSYNSKYMDIYYKDTVEKDFSWSIVLKNPQFEQDKILLEDHSIKLCLSADSSTKTGYILFLALSVMKNCPYPLPNQNKITLIDIRQKKEEVITSNMCCVRTRVGAPIVVREHNRTTNIDTYFDVTNENYNSLLTETIKRQLKKNTSFSADLIEKLECDVVEGKKVVVKNYGQLIDATVGTIALKGESCILNYLLQVGIGARRSQSFGALQLVSQIDV